MFFILGSYLLLSALGIHCCVLVFSSRDKQRLFPSYGVQASHCSDFICCGVQAQQLWHVDLVAQWHVGSSWIRCQTHAPCMAAAAAAAASLQLCQTLCYPIDSSPLGSSVSEILQTRILEWVAISFSNAWKWKAKKCPTLSNPMDCRLLCPWDFPGKSTGVGCHCLLHPCMAGRFLTAQPPGEFHELPRFSICQNLKIFLQKPNQKSFTISNLHALCKSLTNESCLIFFV